MVRLSPLLRLISQTSFLYGLKRSLLMATATSSPLGLTSYATTSKSPLVNCIKLPSSFNENRWVLKVCMNPLPLNHNGQSSTNFTSSWVGPVVLRKKISLPTTRMPVTPPLTWVSLTASPPSNLSNHTPTPGSSLPRPLLERNTTPEPSLNILGKKSLLPLVNCLGDLPS